MHGIIFDFDGVIADSELLANTVLAEAVTGLGVPTSPDEAIDRFMGKRWPDIVAAIEGIVGGPVREQFSEELIGTTLERFRTDLREVQGVRDFIRRFEQVPRAIASSSSLRRLHHCLEVLDLAQTFGGHVYSAEMVARGKPHPDIFLHAAAQLGVEPAECLVFEDSAGGVRAAHAAGMTVIGLCAGGHCRPGHAQKLLAAGAHQTVASWEEATRVASSLLVPAADPAAAGKPHDTGHGT